MHKWIIKLNINRLFYYFVTFGTYSGVFLKNNSFSIPVFIWFFFLFFLTIFTHSLTYHWKTVFVLLASRAPKPLLSHHAKSFKASVASLAQPLQPHQPPAAAHNSACPLGWASREGSRARTPRTLKHPEQLEVPSSHPASQRNNQNRKSIINQSQALRKYKK